MTPTLRVCLCAVWALPGCSVASVAEQASKIAQNQCGSDADCPVGSCGDGRCRSTNGTFPTILFEVTPPADQTSISGVQFLKRVDSLPTAGGPLDLSLDLVAQVAGEVTLATRDCTPKFVDDQGRMLATPPDGSIPAVISLIPSTQALGLFSSPIAVLTTLTKSSYFGFSIKVPPGSYDIYVEPKGLSGTDCLVPPQLLRGQAIKGGSLPLNVTLPAPSTFDLHVAWPSGNDALADWVVEMLDPVTGRVISNQALLSLSPGSTTDYFADLAYLPVVDDTSKVKAQELVRLSPPAGVTAPSVLSARGALGLFSANSGTLSQFASLPTPVHVAGQVTASGTPAPAAATVTLVATKIDGIDPGVLASFVRTADVGAGGTFDVDLLPGTYRVYAAPSGDSGSGPNCITTMTCFSQVNTEWVVAGSPAIQAGKVIELSKTVPVNGQVYDASRSIQINGAQVQAVASPSSIVTDVLRQALGETAYIPRASSSTVGDHGNFKLSLDSGTFDISVRPQASTGFPWLVRPNVPVGTTPATSAGIGLGTLSLPLPVVYSGGTVTVPGTMASSVLVAGATIRAYLYMNGGAYTTDPAQADSVLQIAETRSDDAGQFELLIPAALNTP